MEGLKIRWLRKAVRSLDEQAAFIARDNPMAAVRVATRVYDAVGQLVSFPKLGPVGRVRGTRELVVSGTPYIVAYRIRRNRIEVLRVVHGAMRWPRTL